MIPLPDNYLVLDIETTGLKPFNGAILQIGFLQCLGGVIRAHSSAYLETDAYTLDSYDKGGYVADCKKKGRHYIKAADVRANGLPRFEVFNALRELHQAMMEYCSDAVVVGHNIVGFDIPWIELHAQKNSAPFKFERTRVIDTGALFKANALGMLPGEDEGLWEFFCRVRDCRAKGVLWNLTYAAEQTGVAEKAASAMATAHDAESDVLTTHYVYQALREKELVA